MARAIARAHRKGLIHRDLKPSNILITPEGDAKVVDFGLATLFTRGESVYGGASSVLTRTETFTAASPAQGRVIAGTLPYMSPEQVRGEDLDSRSDIFSLGVVLYEMTTGQRPFGGPTPSDVARRIQEARPRPVHDLVPDVPLELDRSIHKALAPRRGDRYQTMDDLAVDLKLLGRQLESNSAPSYGDLQKAAMRRRWRWVRSRFGVAVAAAVGALALATVGIFLWKARGHPGAPPPVPAGKGGVVLAAIENTTGDSAFDGAIGQTLASVLRDSSFLSVMPDDTVRAWLRSTGRGEDTRLSGSVAREVCQKSRSEVVVETSVVSLGTRHVLGVKGINCLTGEPVAGEEVESRTKEGVLDAFPAATSRILKRLEANHVLSLAAAAKRAGGSAASFPLFRRAAELDPDWALPHLSLSTDYESLGPREKMVEEVSRAYALREHEGTRSRFLIEAFDTLRRLNDDLAAGRAVLAAAPLGRLEDVVRYAEEAAKIDPGTRAVNHNWAAHLIALDRYDEARTVLADAEKRGQVFPNLQYTLAFLEGDQATMDRIIVGSGSAGTVPEWESSTEAYRGRLHRARELWRQMEGSASRAAGEPAVAFELAAALEKELPSATILNVSALPSIRAAAAFRKILAHRGFVGNSYVGPLARLGLVHALKLAGDGAGAAAEAKALLDIWKEADPDFQPAAEVRSIVEGSLH